MTTKKSRLTKRVNQVAGALEVAIALGMILVIIYLFVQMVVEFSGYALSREYFDANQFIARAIHLVIGIEFAKMLYLRTPASVIDMLMLATARQAILDQTQLLENLLATIAIGILFVLRKYVVSEKIEIKKPAKLRFWPRPKA